MSNTIIYNTNLNSKQFNIYCSLHTTLYTLSNLTIGFLAYDFIFSRFNLDRDNIILIGLISLASLISLIYIVYFYIIKLKIINSFNIENKEIILIDDKNIDELKNYITNLSTRIDKIEINTNKNNDNNNNGNNNTTDKIVLEKEEIDVEIDDQDAV